MSLTADIDLKDLVRTIPDYPKPGIMFRDITTLLGHANGLRACIERLVAPFTNRRIESVAGIEARGFILGGAVADRLRCGFVPIRKKGKLPAKAIGQEYELEYGIDIIEIHEDALKPGEPVLLVDDLIATGGTAEAAVKLLRKLNAEVDWRGLRHRFARSRRFCAPRQTRDRVPHADGLRGGLRLAT
jgi:adenine phosphoribosyltransferase